MSTIRQPTETAHVLFIDHVGYSRLLNEAQLRAVRTLTRIVHGAPAFLCAEAAEEVLVSPAGDGMALVFFRNPLAPVECATEIARGASAAEIPLRMGIHVGPVSRITDAAGHAGVAGDGINRAQRVMDCGDAGHILVSGSVAEMLGHYESWQSALRDLGEAEVKHGERVRLFNICLGEIGNAAVPAKLLAAHGGKPEGKGEWENGRMGEADPDRTPKTLHATPIRQLETGPTVALLYKRHAPRSAHLLEVLDEGLSAAGFQVFIDRHMTVGVEWAAELKRKVRDSDAVVPLLSAESIWSEMVEDEVRTADEARQRHGTRPRLLPVRVAYEGPLPEPLANILDPLQYVKWRGPEDDAALVDALVAALSAPEPTTPTDIGLEPVGGAVPLDSTFYLARTTDGEFAAALARRDSIVLVKGARQMGKTSLLTRGLQQARDAGATCFRTDFQKLTSRHLESEENFFLTLAEMIADQLNLDDGPDVAWHARRGGAHNFERFLRRQVLEPSDRHVVWALDEVDRLFVCPFGSDVFALFRSWHNDRAYEPTGPWSKLTMAIAYATEAHLFITDVNQSPFNVGTRLTLEDFTVAEVAELNRRYGSPLQDAGQVERYHALTGGQPYLTRRGLDHLVGHRVGLKDVEAEASRDEGLFGDHLRRLLVSVTHDASTLETVRSILRGEPLPNAAAFYRLRSGGLLSGSSEHDFRLRCGVYGEYLRRHLT